MHTAKILGVIFKYFIIGKIDYDNPIYTPAIEPLPPNTGPLHTAGLHEKRPTDYTDANQYLNRHSNMKVKSSVKADPSKGDILVIRRGVRYVINKKDPNRKQRQKGPARKK